MYIYGNKQKSTRKNKKRGNEFYQNEMIKTQIHLGYIRFISVESKCHSRQLSLIEFSFHSTFKNNNKKKKKKKANSVELSFLM